MYPRACFQYVIFATSATLISILVLTSTWYAAVPLPLGQKAFLYVGGAGLFAGGLVLWFAAIAVASAFLESYLPVRKLYLASIYGRGRTRTGKSILA